MRNTLLLMFVVPTFAGVGVAFAQAGGGPAKPNLNAFDTDAIDRAIKPCDDFYEYAIGTWHNQHPIPSTQVRWGKRWAAAEYNRDNLRDLVETIAAKKTGRNLGEQLIGSMYSACMNAQAVDALGSKPVQPLLRRIDAIDSREALQRELGRLAAQGIAVPFAIAATVNSEHPDQMIAGIVPRGLGLPDRDYYLKDDPKSKETRERYLAHVAKLLELAGQEPSTAAAAARNALQFETALARAQLSRVERRDPYKV
ncbi:MAG TPA: M13 family metallopeptidase N-terminal domain-containing protein, partial [Bryobacteraceae bacterium]|nr:M13 family metallopeptidase N-terminal domain-containing protein [Bryobacteraceae bacterium]